jgi:hypothetical protein
MQVEGYNHDTSRPASLHCAQGSTAEKLYFWVTCELDVAVVDLYVLLSPSIIRYMGYASIE